MNNVIMRKVVLTEEYQPLSDRPLVMTGEISAPPTNSGPVYFQGLDGQDVPWLAGEWHLFIRSDLSEIFAKGVEGDILTVVGGTW